MQPPLTFANAKVQLNLLTSQTGNFTFTDDEITQALTFAWDDTYVVQPVENSTLTYTPGTYIYTIPTGVSVVKQINFIRTINDYEEPISPDLYTIRNGNIEFGNNMRRWLYDNYTLYIKGSYKIQITDTLPTINLINYVLHLAAEQLLVNLILKKTFVFLRNDTSMQEISQALQLIQNRTLSYKQALLREFELA